MPDKLAKLLMLFVSVNNVRLLNKQTKLPLEHLVKWQHNYSNLQKLLHLTTLS